MDLSKVEHVVLTHLHADHCDGIDTVVKECEDAVFWLPAALPQERIKEVIAEVVDESKQDRRKKMEAIGSAFRYATEPRDRHRLRLAVARKWLDDKRPDEIRLLGPTESAAQAAQGYGDDPVEPRILLRENATSAVLWVQAGEARALLTGDMDNNNRFGWPTVFAELEGAGWLGGAGLVKVAHHGSKGSHHLPVYDGWSTEPIAIVTPNTGLDDPLPRPTDFQKVIDLASEAWLAGPPFYRDRDRVKLSKRIYWVAVSADPDEGTWRVRASAEDDQELAALASE